MNNSESTIIGILILVGGLVVLGLITYGFVKLVLWIIKQWKFINERCSINHNGFRPLSFFKQSMVLLGIAAFFAGIFLLSEGIGSNQIHHGNNSAEVFHGACITTTGFLLLTSVFFWIRARANAGVAFYSVLLMTLVSFLFLLALLLAFLSFAGKNQQTNQSNNSPTTDNEPKSIGTVVQSTPDRVTIYDEKGNLIRTLIGVLDSFTPSVVNLRPTNNSNLVQAFDVNGNLKYSRQR
jgi:hypothetical protein